MPEWPIASVTGPSHKSVWVCSQNTPEMRTLLHGSGHETVNELEGLVIEQMT